MRPDDTVAPPRTHRVEGLVHKKGSFIRKRLRGSPTPTPQPLRHRIVSSSGWSKRPAEKRRAFLSVYWLIYTKLAVTVGFQTLLRNKCFCNPSDTTPTGKRKYCCIWQLCSLFRVPVDILNKQSRTDDKAWSSSLEVGDVSTTSHLKNVSCYEIFTHKASVLDLHFAQNRDRWPVFFLGKKKKRNGLEIFEKEANRNFLRWITTSNFAVEKLDDRDVDEDKGFLLSLLPYFRRFNDENKSLARIEFLKITRLFKLQQYLETHSSFSFPSFSNANIFPPNSSHFASNRLIHNQ